MLKCSGARACKQCCSSCLYLICRQQIEEQWIQLYASTFGICQIVQTSRQGQLPSFDEDSLLLPVGRPSSPASGRRCLAAPPTPPLSSQSHLYCCQMIGQILLSSSEALGPLRNQFLIWNCFLICQHLLQQTFFPPLCLFPAFQI